MNDDKLKAALAKMLPRCLSLDGLGYLYWADSDTGSSYSREVLDTELLHLLSLVESGLEEKERPYYVCELWRLIARAKIFTSVTTTWQQRVTALAKIKNIEL